MTVDFILMDVELSCLHDAVHTTWIICTCYTKRKYTPYTHTLMCKVVNTPINSL